MIICWAACELDKAHLAGDWQAVALYELGQSVNAELDSVRLSFQDEGMYEFRSIGFYREAGPFRSSGQYLFLTDTTVRPARDRTLRVLFLSEDTLKIRMQKGGNEQVVFMSKIR